MNFLLIVGSSRLEDLDPFQKRACNHNMRLPGDACQGAILGPKAGWTSSPDPSFRWGYEASLKTGVSLHPPPAGMYRGGLLPQYSIDRACKRRRMGVDIVQAYAAEISTERTAGTAKAWSTCRAISGCGGT